MNNPYAPAGGQQGAIEIKTSFIPLAFLLYLCNPRASIDGGEPIAHGWTTRLYRVPAGRHHVQAWCPYLFLTRMGEAAIDVDVPPGQVVGIQWKAPWLTLMPGSWVGLGVRPLTPQDLAAEAGTPRPATAPNAAPHPNPNPRPTAAPAASAPPPGWHPDPHRQAAHRWWDGQRWTEHVSNG